MEEMIQLAHENFARWNEALHTGDPQQVAALYTTDCDFLPTLDPQLRNGRVETAEYFIHFLEKHPYGTIVEESIKPLGDGFYTHIGLYNFEIGEPEKKTDVMARFTYIWQKVDEEWLISHHHSSLIRGYGLFHLV